MVPWKDGVLEHYASGQFFKKRWNKSGEELFREACEGCTEATVAFEEFGRNVGAAINLILLAVDPELIILGGSVSKSFPYFRDTMWSSLSSFPYLRSLQRLRIEVSELESAAVLGAAALLYEARGTGPASTDEEWGHFH